jgi:hypothetical protein
MGRTASVRAIAIELRSASEFLTWLAEQRGRPLRWAASSLVEREDVRVMRLRHNVDLPQEPLRSRRGREFVSAAGVRCARSQGLTPKTQTEKLTHLFTATDLTLIRHESYKLK